MYRPYQSGIALYQMGKKRMFEFHYYFLGTNID